MFVLESKDEREKKSDCERGAVTVALGQELTPTPALARPVNSQRLPPPNPTKSSGFPVPAGWSGGSGQPQGHPGGEAGREAGMGHWEMPEPISTQPKSWRIKPLPICRPADGGTCLVSAR